ncbi:NnrS family protein [Pseudomonas sp. F1_0610]|uniref:NnrS family protein n=1 Tax=Pseudomonas sp. F1_0610 TaxID=3114284 RepID=UPI0039C06877
MNIIDRRQALTITPILRLAFRPFFLAGAILALLAVPIWILAHTGKITYLPAGSWLAWHRHELVFGFAGAIVTGFLLTAGQTWTGQPGLSGKPLLALFVLWLAARVLWFIPSALPVLLVVDALFYPTVAWCMWLMVGKVKQYRNYPIVGVLLLLGVANIVSLYDLYQGGELIQRNAALSALFLVAALMTVIGGRVIPFFTRRGLLREEGVEPWVWLDNALLVGMVLLALATLTGFNLQQNILMGILLCALAIGHGIRAFRWYDKGIWRVNLLWSLHLSYWWLVIACSALAAWHFSLLNNFSSAIHSFTIGAMSGMILAMLARVTLGHTGRKLEPPKFMVIAFISLNIAAFCRIFVVELNAIAGWHSATTFWVLSFALFVIGYTPMLCKARVDGNPG